ncbi:hypothetical protein V6Z12_A03G185100 [Gossypium hirsutum]
MFYASKLKEPYPPKIFTSHLLSSRRPASLSWRSLALTSAVINSTTVLNVLP